MSISVVSIAMGFCLMAGCQASPHLGLATSGPTQLVPPASVPSGLAQEEWGTRWCFRAGAPVTDAPALGPRGEVYVATNEGYVHALRADGSFHWSYTLKGAAKGPVVVLPDGTLVVATTLNLLYALKPTGRREWVYRAPEPITTHLGVSRHGTLVFGAAKDTVYAVSRRGGLLWRLPLNAPITTTPYLNKNGNVFIGTTKGTVTFKSPMQRTLWESPPVQRFVEPPAGGPPFWLASGRAFSSNGPVNLGSDVEFLVLLESGASIALTTNRMLWRDAQGALQYESRLEAPPSGSPMVAEGQVLVPLEDGAIMSATLGSPPRLHAQIGASPVSDLVLDRERHRVIAASGEGLVCAASWSP